MEHEQPNPYAPTLGQEHNQNFRYNGKEFYSGIGWSDYGARFYNSSLGRWMSIDPLAEKYMSLSTYHFSGNNPVNLIDIDGRYFTGFIEIIDNIREDAQNYISRNFEKANNKYTKADIQMSKGHEKRAEKLRAQGDSYKNKAINAAIELDRFETEIQEMEESDINFHIEKKDDNYSFGNSKSDMDIDGVVEYNVTSLRVDIKFKNGTSNAAHELKHGYQYLKGQINYINNGRTPGILYDKTDEVAAYNRSYFLLGDGKLSNVYNLPEIYKNLPQEPRNLMSYSSQRNFKNNSYMRYAQSLIIKNK